MKNIRTFNMKDLDRIMEIWLNSNLDSHNFVDKNYWLDNFQFVKDLIPSSNLYIYEINSNIVGFIGLTENYISGIFIDSEYRGQGIGKKLLAVTKENYKKLSLDVYENNNGALNFYLREGFHISKKSTDSINNQIELHMTWPEKN